jgi:hypothetical protein
MHERHYLRVADEAMREAVLTLYRDDPISDRHAAALALRPVAATERKPGDWLQIEANRGGLASGRRRSYFLHPLC